jgi:hypothetical protein
MPLPDTLTTCSRVGSEGHDTLCDAFLEAYGFVLVSCTWYEILTVSPVPAPDGTWTWRLRLVRDVGRA